MDLQSLEIYKAELQMIRERLRDANPQNLSAASVETVWALENAIQGFGKLINAKRRRERRRGSLVGTDAHNSSRVATHNARLAVAAK